MGARRPTKALDNPAGQAGKLVAMAAELEQTSRQYGVQESRRGLAGHHARRAVLGHLR